MVNTEIKRLDPKATVTLDFGLSGGRRRARSQTKKTKRRSKSLSKKVRKTRRV
jgi:hypothetical protein